MRLYPDRIPRKAGGGLRPMLETDVKGCLEWQEKSKAVSRSA
jgi:hypothetical protein